VAPFLVRRVFGAFVPPISLTLLRSMLKIQGSAGKARVGTFMDKIATPHCLAYCQRGAPTHLTPDNFQRFAKLQPTNIFHLTLPELIAAHPVVKKQGQGLHKFLNLDDSILYLSVRDPLTNNLGPCNEQSYSLASQNGKTRLTPEQFMEVQHAFRPDFFACLSDEILSSSTSARARKSLARSLAFLDRCIALHQKPASSASASNEEPAVKKARTGESKDDASSASASSASSSPASSSSSSALFAVVHGGSDAALRVQCAKEMAKRAAVGGFVIGGLETGELNETRYAMIEAVVGQLPDEKPRVMSGLGSPEEVLECVERGVDLFESPYPHTVTQHGFASVYPLNPETKAMDTDSSASSAPASSSASKINLRDKIYEKDQRPLLEGCACFTCQNHTRAYIHHLLNVHEMLAQVLLQTHNLHHYLDFFRVIRQHIAQGTFAEFKKSFLQRLKQ